MKKTALITGITGQDGAYLAKHLLEQDYKVYGMIRKHTNMNFSNLDYVGATKDVDLQTGDLTDECSVLNLVKSLKPTEIYNLAAQSFVGVSWDIPRHTTDVDAIGVLNILNAVKVFSPTTKFYQASTSEMFGNATEEFQSEYTSFTPRSPYAIAKLYAHWMTVNYRESYNIYATSGILFNHESPIRGKEFVTRKITDGVARIVSGLQSHIELGNLEAKRDWGFAGDYVKAMHLMLQQENPDDFVIATGQTHSIAEFLDIAFSYVGVDDYMPYVKINSAFKRPAELFSLCGDASKAKNTLGWVPEVDFHDLVEMMLKEDLKRYGQQINLKVKK